MENTLNILVVDDEQVVLDSIVKHLRKENYIVKTVLSANDAIKLITKTRVDIVLTDLMMPEIDGLDFMRQVKSDLPNIPVIIITGYATINTALQATRLGAFDYIAKPFTKAELLAVVKRAAEITQSATALNKNDNKANPGQNASDYEIGSIKSIGENCWMIVEKSGQVLIGVEHAFLQTIGKIQNVQLPSVGDQLRQGSVYLQIYSTDMILHKVQSPLSGTVTEINQKAVEDPNATLEDPYGKGWLMRLNPTKLDFEVKEMDR